MFFHILNISIRSNICKNIKSRRIKSSRVYEASREVELYVMHSSYFFRIVAIIIRRWTIRFL